MKRLIQILFVISFLVGITGVSLQQAVAQDENPAPVPNPLTLTSSSDKGVVFDVNLDWQGLTTEPVNLDGKDFTQVTLPDATTRSIPGMPELPILVNSLAVPFGVKVEIEVTSNQPHTYQLSQPVVPGAAQAAVLPLPGESEDPGFTPEVKLSYDLDPAVYDQSGQYPGLFGEVSNDGVIREQRVVGITLYPVQYEPTSRQLTVYESLHVEVSFKGTPILAPKKASVESDAYEAFFSTNLLNYQGSADWRLPEDSITKNTIGSTRTGSLPWVPPDPGWRIKVQQTGFYKLSYTELQSAGLPVDSLDPTTFQIFHLGSEMAIQVSGESDNSFDVTDSILFYGESYEDKYTRDNVYWLTYGTTAGKRVATRDVTPGSGTLASSYVETTHLEQNVWYVNLVPGEDGLERWLWGAAFNNGSSNTIWSSSFSLSDPISAPAQLTIFLAAASYSAAINPDHHAVIKINNQDIVQSYWDGPETTTVTAEIPSGILVDGTNVITVSLPRDTGASYDYVYIDWFEVAYPREFKAINDQIHIEYDTTGISKFQVDDFTSAAPQLFDITDPWSVTELTGMEVQGTSAPYSIIFEDNVVAPITYFATTDTQALSVSSITQDTPSALQTGSADYILITHADFLDQATAITDYRSGQGLRTALVDVRDIYDQFGYGIEGATPIKAFLAYAYDQWTKPAPSYVMLVGTGHYNPKNFNPGVYGVARTNYIPPYLAYVDTSAYPTTETAADNRYVTITGEDNLPDMMLGRLGATTPDEVTAYLQKVMTYEQVPGDAIWKNKILAVADNADAAGNFSVVMESVLQCCMPKRYEAQRVYLGIDPYTTGALARTAITNGINSGKFIVNYQGHGATSEWASEGMFRYSDISSLTNSAAFPIVLSMTCNVGFYANPQPPGGAADSLARQLTVASGKGAIAGWASTGTGLVTGHIPLNQGFYNAIFLDNTPTIGYATNDAKLRLWETSANLELIDTYLLFGDPALQITITPGAPRGYAPSGIISSVNPTFSWAEVPNADYYNLVLFAEGGESSRATGDAITPEVKGSTLILDQFVPSNVCSARTCSFTPSPSLDLPYGPYNWKVRAYFGSDYTEFSSDTRFFNVSVSMPVQPVGTWTTRNPKFVWNQVEEATQYTLRVSQGTTTVKEILIETPNCPYYCNYRSATNLNLANGTYDFSVKAYVGNWGDYGWTKSFSIANPPAPQYPAGYTTSPNPKFIWTKVADQTKYQIIVYDSTGKELLSKELEPSACGTTTCSYLPNPALSLVNGTYKWKVRSLNFLWGPYSGLKSFTKVDPPAPVSPSGTTVERNPVFTWKKVTGATKYTVEVRTSAGTLVRSMVVLSTFCGIRYCEYVPAPNLNLVKDTYRWRVKAFNGYYGPFSNPMVFTRK